MKEAEEKYKEVKEVKYLSIAINNMHLDVLGKEKELKLTIQQDLNILQSIATRIMTKKNDEIFKKYITNLEFDSAFDKYNKEDLSFLEEMCKLFMEVSSTLYDW